MEPTSANGDAFQSLSDLPFEDNRTLSRCRRFSVVPRDTWTEETNAVAIAQLVEAVCDFSLDPQFEGTVKAFPSLRERAQRVVAASQPQRSPTDVRHVIRMEHSPEPRSDVGTSLPVAPTQRSDGIQSRASRLAADSPFVRNLAEDSSDEECDSVPAEEVQGLPAESQGPSRTEAKPKQVHWVPLEVRPRGEGRFRDRSPIPGCTDNTEDWCPRSDDRRPSRPVCRLNRFRRSPCPGEAPEA